MSTSTRHDPVVVAEPYRGIYAHGVETPHLACCTSQVSWVSRRVTTCLRTSPASAVTPSLTHVVKMSFFLMRREDIAGLVDQDARSGSDLVETSPNSTDCACSGHS